MTRGDFSRMLGVGRNNSIGAIGFCPRRSLASTDKLAAYAHSEAALARPCVGRGIDQFPNLALAISDHPMREVTARYDTYQLSIV